MGGKSVIIIGGGLVGSLCAIFMARRGYQVTVFEYREDIREKKLDHGRSINLALSNRGRRALRAVSLESSILQNAIPMKGRLLHNVGGGIKTIPYDILSNQVIYSIGRNYLNQFLLTAAESYPNVKLLFSHKLVCADFDNGSVTILDVKNDVTKLGHADLIIGADGAFSALRRFMQQTELFDFSQTYIKHGYVELSIPSERGDQMVPNHLHIWPRTQFMMIALPNQDKSWTVTLVMPFTKFEKLDNSEKLLNFFKETFPDSIPLIGEELLVADFFKKEPSTLISIKCNPYHVGGKFLIIGDAAHAMVPFYGQGMNAGFEDCLLLDRILTKNQDNISLSLLEFSENRKDDAYTICELALYNYVEMRDLVTKRSYHCRKFFDSFMYKLFPNIWIPLYISVVFSDMTYGECKANRKWQDQVLQKVILGLGCLLGAIIVFTFTLS